MNRHVDEIAVSVYNMDVTHLLGLARIWKPSQQDALRMWPKSDVWSTGKHPVASTCTHFSINSEFEKGILNLNNEGGEN